MNKRINNLIMLCFPTLSPLGGRVGDGGGDNPRFNMDSGLLFVIKYICLILALSCYPLLKSKVYFDK